MTKSEHDLEDINSALQDLDMMVESVRQICSITANIIKQVLEKQIPQKPKEVVDDYGYFVCGKCGMTIGYIGEKEEHKYCFNCGQKIDWN